jgi:LysM repeat protein
MAEQLYTVKAGDTLSKVASQYGVNVSDISGYASGDPNKIGVGENLKVMTRDIPPANTIAATDLGQAPLKTPPITPTTGYAGLIASTNAAITNLQPDVDQGKADIKTKYVRLGALPGEKADAYKDEKVY